MPNLIILNLSNAAISEWPLEMKNISKWSTKFPKLYKIDLYWNNITHFDVHLPNGVPMHVLKNYTGHIHTEVILKHCLIKGFTRNNLVVFETARILHVDLRNNPISYDCQLKPALEYVYDHLEYFANSYYKHLWNEK